MSSFLIDSAPLLFRGGVEPPSTALVIALLFAFGIIHSAIQPSLYPLLSSALAWAIIYATCRFLSISSSSRHQRTPKLLAACIFASAVCTRAGNNNCVEIALAPLACLVLRELSAGGGEHAVGASRWRAAIVIAVGGLLALGARDGRALVLSACASGFSMLALVLFEEMWAAREWAGLGRETAMWLVPALLAASLAMESLVVETITWDGDILRSLASERAGTGWWSVVWAALLEAAHWGFVPILVARQGAVAVGFVELATGLGFGLFSGLSNSGKLGVAMETAGMAWWFLCGRFKTLHMVLMAGTCMAFWGFFHFRYSADTYTYTLEPEAWHSTSTHPITGLIQDAEMRFADLLEKQSTTLAEAVDEYERRYRMPPPPNFDKWYAYAKEHGTVLIDEYDTIFHSLRPFWGLPPAEVRKRARETMGFRDEFMLKDNKMLHAYIRAGKVEISGQGPEWQKKATKSMIEDFALWLSDMDLPFNIHDEPRVMVPHAELAQLLIQAGVAMERAHTNKLYNKFTQLSVEEKALPADFPTTPFNVFAHQSIWTSAVLSCPPDSPSRNITLPANFTDLSQDTPTNNILGLIRNTTSASDICHIPSLAQRHGFFERPNAFNVVKRLYPVFSQSKVSSFGDILYPSPWYWAEKVKYDESVDPAWENKTQILYWRGSTTGGFSRMGGWKHHHRQIAVSAILANDSAPVLRHARTADVWEPAVTPRAQLRQTHFDVQFSHIGQCDAADCTEQKAFFNPTPRVAPEKAYGSALLLDMDGNAFSGRYHAFLRSHSAVLKMAVFREWSDEWLMPWVHYVPLSPSMSEVAEVVRYFVDEEEGKMQILRIAEESRRWAERVLRKKDMEVWLFRLLLEWGRVVDDAREVIGYDHGAYV